MPSQEKSAQAARGELETHVAAELSGVAQGPKLLSDKGIWVTFLAREPCCGSRVFLNIRRRGDLDERTIEEVLRAAERNRSTRHPAVLPVRRYGCTDDFLWVTTRAYRGRLLSHSVKSERVRSLSGAVGFLRQVAGPLEAIHRAGLVHGALSGSAFHCDVEGRVRVRNLEIETPILRACLQAGIRTDAGSFSAPEVREGADPEPASDQYAVAAIVLGMLGVRVPVNAADLARHGVPQSTARALLQALQPNAEDRWRSVAALADAIGGPEDAGYESAPLVERGRDPRGALSPMPVTSPGFGARLQRGSSFPPVDAQVSESPSHGSVFGSRALATTAVVLMFAATLGPLVESRRGNTLPDHLAEASITVPEAQAPDTPPSESEGPGPVDASPDAASPVPAEVSREAAPPASDDDSSDAAPLARAEPERPTPQPVATTASRPSAEHPARAAIPPLRPEPRPAVASAPVPPPAEPGGLSLQSYPWGAAYLDGTFVGNTPLVEMRVSSGSHSLRIERIGYEPYVDQVTVRPGQVLRLTGIVLEETGR